MAVGSGESATTPPAGVVPRWEWRTFGAPFGTAAEVLADLTPQRARSSEELYFVSLHSDASVKVRDGLMDVKQLLRVDDDGLELWTPVLQASFPLSREDVSTVLTSLGVAGSVPRLTSYSLDGFVDELIRPLADVRTVEVHKQRAHYLVDECSVESTEITVGHETTHTLAIESPDPSLVSATVSRLGLADRRNVSLARGLKTLVGFGTRRHAVIDVGTNSVKFHIVERHADGSRHAVVDRADITRLGEGQADSGVLAGAAIARTVEVIAAMVDEARRAGATDIVGVGTAGLRRAPNQSALIDAVSARAGLTVEVITGEEEGRLAYLAATSALPAVEGPARRVRFGRRQHAVHLRSAHHIDERFSLEVGAVRIAERFGLASAVATKHSTRRSPRSRPSWNASTAVRGPTPSWRSAAPQPTSPRSSTDSLATTLTVVHGTVLDIAELDRQIELYRTRSAGERRDIAGLQPARADVILAGACIVRTISTKLETDVDDGE